MIIKFYLDESGHQKAHFFGIGGLYYFYEDDINSQFYGKDFVLNKQNEMRMWGNFRYLSNEIKKTMGKDSREELKASETDHNAKEFLFSNLKNFGQKSISIFCDNKKWDANKRDKNNSNLNVKYNYLLKIMIERFLKFNLSEINNFFPNNEVNIEICCDERGNATKFSKNRTLEQYLNDELSLTFPFLKLNIKLIFLHSDHYMKIQYADFIVNLIFLSMYLIYKVKPSGYYDKKILEIYENFHQRICCNRCHTFSMPINSLCKNSVKIPIF